MQVTFPHTTKQISHEMSMNTPLKCYGLGKLYHKTCVKVFSWNVRVHEIETKNVVGIIFCARTMGKK